MRQATPPDLLQAGSISSSATSSSSEVLPAPLPTHNLSEPPAVTGHDSTSQEGWRSANGKKAKREKAKREKATSKRATQKKATGSKHDPSHWRSGQPIPTGGKADAAAASGAPKNSKAAAASGAAAFNRQTRSPTRPVAHPPYSALGFSASNKAHTSMGTGVALVGQRLPLQVLKHKRWAMAQALCNLVCLETGPAAIRSYRPIRGELALLLPEHMCEVRLGS